MLGKILKNLGQVYGDDKIAVVHKNLLEGEEIASHNHPEANIFFTLVSGEVEVYLNDKETYKLNEGEILNFNGDNYISAKGLKDSDIYVFLVRK